MSKTNIGLFSIFAGFVLVWGGATGRIGGAWNALVKGEKTASPTTSTTDDATAPDLGHEASTTLGLNHVGTTSYGPSGSI